MFEELETDLASTAADAALELDHLSLGRPAGFSATHRLAGLIGETVSDVPDPWSPDSLLNPATAVALGKALDEALYAGEATMKRLPELIKESARFKERLAAIVAHPERAIPSEKEELRSVCVALSRQAAAVEGVGRYRREHPFRKYA